MATEHEEYLAVLKASYDYDPQSDDEIVIKEGQLLFLKERVDDDWWKVKIKGDLQDGDSPVGLVPSAYVEQAEHTSIVKAIYNYDAAAPGELSVTEAEILLVYDTEDDWLLVQSQNEGGKAGFVPGNYVEPFDEDAAHIPAPDTPSPSARPTSAYIDPADLVASTKVKSDGIETWSVSEVDRKGKKKKGTLGVGNGAVFFASEADKTPVQKWQTTDIEAVKIEKAKHVHISIGGTAPITLHFHTGSKDNADAIESKLRSSKTFSIPSTAENTPDESDAPVSGRPSIEVLKEVKKASVHFSTTSPTIIPSEAPVDLEEDDGAVSGDQDSGGEIGTALYDFAADGEDELSVAEGEQLLILERDGDEWWKCRNSHGVEGVVPASYLEVSAAVSKPRSSTPTGGEDEENLVSAQAVRQAEIRAEELRVKAEQEEIQAEKARKKAEAQERAKAAAIAAEVERKKRKEAAAARVSPPPVVHPSPPDVEKASSGRTSRDGTNSRPPADKVRVWHDRSGQFRVEAAFLGFTNGKLRLHKVNGVVVEVPSEKMSVEDMDYIEKVTKRKKSRPPATQRISEDDIPLGIQRTATSSNKQKPSTTPKKSPQIDWFDFFLSAGCDLDDCTRYAASFERDKIDELILPNITESTMRSLGLREGDIIRTKIAIEKRKPTDNLIKSSAHTQEQLLRDEELARKLQAQEAGSTRSPPPNLFTGPGGVLKSGGRRRPQPTKSAPAIVDLKAIATVSDQIQRTGSPQQMSPHNARSASASVQPPPRSNSALPAASGFDDDAWTNRPSSTQPLAGTPPSTTPRAPSVPPPAPSTIQPVPTPPPAKPASPPPPPASVAQPSAPSLAKTTESDIFEQLSRLSDLRKNTPTNPSISSPLGATSSPAPPSFQAGLGMGSSPVSMGHLQIQQTNSYPQSVTPTYNGPRGPYAPVPTNQSLLQPLIPTQTGFNNFIPTRPSNSLSQFQNPPAQPSFLPPQLTGYSNANLLSSQPTGFHNMQPLGSQPTGAPFNPINPGVTFHNNGFSPVPSSAGPNFNTSPFNLSSPPPPVPPLPNSTSNNTNPANIFAQMKSGTFASENDQNPPPSDKYDTLRPNTLTSGWGQQPYQTGWNGYQQR